MLKPYFLTTKSNLMTKFKMNGKSMLMGLSFFAFMILGSVNASAQWMSPTQATAELKQQIETLENDFNAATTTAAKINIAFEKQYYETIMTLINVDGVEVPASVQQAKPTFKPAQHSSGLVVLTSDVSYHPNFKTEVQGLVDDATDLLSF